MDIFNVVEVDVVVFGIFSDLGWLILLNKLLVWVFYDYVEVKELGLGKVLDLFLVCWGLGSKVNEFF